MNPLRRLFGPRGRKAPPHVKTPVKITVTARKVRADGTLGEPVEVKHIRVEEVT